MKVKVKFFASYREVLGKDDVDVNLDEGANVTALIDLIKKKYPELGSLTETLIVSVNREYTEYDAVLKDGDEVALLPPVSGG
jgi:molybdopterin converting factor subunit 1